jgi:hypothetical protein
LNDLSLLEGHSTSFITISYSILFRSAPGSASPVRRSRARQSRARRSGVRRSGGRRGGGEREAEVKRKRENQGGT